MSTVAFDTLKFVEKLQAGGFTPTQARAATGAFADPTGERLVTKADLNEAVSTLRMEIANSKLETVKWTFSMFGFQTVIILGAVLALAKFAHP